ncbi:MAG: TfuA-like protein [Pseudomonadota bacterium]
MPPAEQGDVFAAAERSPVAIGIVDGYFHQVPSVWHKEILWAMSQGIHVFGSASMGALRAAELGAFGMVGVGRIYEDFREGRITNDDDVAVTHGPAELGYMALSEALANIRATLHESATQGIISDATHRTLLEIARDTFFPERNFDSLLRSAHAQQLPEGEIDALATWLPAGRIDRKREDAIEMLCRMSEFLATKPERMEVRYHVEKTYLFDGHAG